MIVNRRMMKSECLSKIVNDEDALAVASLLLCVLQEIIVEKAV